ncbi:MFS transporter [Asticcacaulis sp. ZE23SCel15]|uniref:MFS transporter n=1 Tax=Asticcacaulis sp. ZE23SCel15 TaxID=3059027 RepID=UPI00265E8CFF|nr:MFS transporter [Asticcacaulis sp. ZE23SCel15]WKL56708.1 MFS transporter [Asticcacaulis sp. ZE23SCel15]
MTDSPPALPPQLAYARRQCTTDWNQRRRLRISVRFGNVRLWNAHTRVLGPPLGGFIVIYLDWRWIFYLNIPIGLIGIIMVMIFVPAVPRVPTTKIDWIGFILSGVSLSCLLISFEMAIHSADFTVLKSLLIVGSLAWIGYLRHARMHSDPLIDLTLLNVPTFRISIIGGSLMRITQGAQPFLVAMMLQLGLGFNAAHAGLIALAGAIGSLIMKLVARRILVRFGYRDTLIVSGMCAVGGYALCGFFRPDWPLMAILSVLATASFFMSLQFTAYNTIAYADISTDRMSAATSFYSNLQQLLLTLGVCVGSLALHVSMTIGHQDHLEPVNFTHAFIVVTCISALATFFNGRISANEGRSLME